LTLVLSEGDVGSLLDMSGAVTSVEEAFRRQAHGEAVNAVRTRSRTPGAVLNVMHASLPYLGRGGLKAYMSSRKGIRFVFVLFDSTDSRPLAVMGADVLGRFRTGAATGVATKFLYGRKSAKLALCGSGRQAMTQVLAVAAITSVAEVRVWSPRKEHREAFCQKLEGLGLGAEPFGTPSEALRGADVASAITSSREPFLDAPSVQGLSHLNICGSNLPDHSEVTAAAVGQFGTVVVDDLSQAKVEYGDLIQAAEAATFSWNDAIELKEVVAGRVSALSPTLFKSGGVALEDVALGSMVYDRALKSGRFSEAKFD
jgi:alanine dehydrogenase